MIVFEYNSFFRINIPREVRFIAIDFMMFEKGKINFRKCIRSVAFPEKLRTFFVHNLSDYSNNLLFLLSIDEYDDTLLSNHEMQTLLSLCEELIQSFTCAEAYTIYKKLKADGLRQQDVLTFAVELQQILVFALENDKVIYTIGD